MTFIEEFYEQKAVLLPQLENEALIEAFNQEVGNTSWHPSRGEYLSALNVEISRRKFKEDRLIIRNGRLSIKKKVNLINNQILSF